MDLDFIKKAVKGAESALKTQNNIFNNGLNSLEDPAQIKFLRDAMRNATNGKLNAKTFMEQSKKLQEDANRDNSNG